MSKTIPHCGLAFALEQVGDRWTFLILRNAFFGQKRFSEFVSSLGIARNILSQRLDTMVENGLFIVEVSPDDARVQEYRLTKKAKELSGALVALRLWAEKWHPDIDFAGTAVENDSGKKIKQLRFRTSDHDDVAPENVRIKGVNETDFLLSPQSTK